MLFVAGAVTVGPGMVVNRPYTEALRSHKDLEKGSAPLWAKACKFYDALGQRLVTAGAALDVLACALDQACTRHTPAPSTPLSHTVCLPGNHAQSCLLFLIYSEC